jgi:hypothetical protein
MDAGKSAGWGCEDAGPDADGKVAEKRVILVKGSLDSGRR